MKDRKLSSQKSQKSKYDVSSLKDLDLCWNKVKEVTQNFTYT